MISIRYVLSQHSVLTIANVQLGEEDSLRTQSSSVIHSSESKVTRHCLHRFSFIVTPTFTLFYKLFLHLCLSYIWIFNKTLAHINTQQIHIHLDALVEKWMYLFCQVCSQWWLWPQTEMCSLLRHRGYKDNAAPNIYFLTCPLHSNCYHLCQISWRRHWTIDRHFLVLVLCQFCFYFHFCFVGN